ncbi:hypothetical protein HDU97_003704 [Phlyctochytrium planicorne]|nr:hypothetical protein HDU97_003704 [Phlyctochytrium planicorne]
MSISTAALVGALAVGTVAAYRWVVPSDIGKLGNLSSVKPKKNEPIAYPEAYWPDSHYAELTHGKTHYFFLGPSDGPKVIAIHGITAGWVAMPAFIEGLAAKGMRVLAFDLYGRGYSDAPGVVYNEELYVSQVKELLGKVGWSKCHVLGYSLGGAIATAFSAKYPETVNKVVLIAPAGLRKSLPTGGKILTFPVIGKFIAHLVGRSILVRLSASKHNPVLVNTQPFVSIFMLYFEKGAISHHISKQQQFIKVTNLIALDHPGFMRAYLSTIDKGPVMQMDQRYTELGSKFEQGRILCIWGTDDTTCDFDPDSKVFRSLIPHARFAEIQSIGHSLLVEIPDQCVDLVTGFILQGILKRKD